MNFSKKFLQLLTITSLIAFSVSTRFASPVDHHCYSIEELKTKALQGVRSGRPVVAFFEGTLDPNTGESWCPDCRKATPVIKESLSKACPELLFLSIEVGERPEWIKDDNPFRIDPLISLEHIPTLLRFQTNTSTLTEESRIQSYECYDSNLISGILC